MLRLGLALAFLYAGVAAFIDPNSWIGDFPLWMRELLPGKLLLGGHSALQIGLALWLFSGRRTFYAALASSLILMLIIIQNITLLDILFRDIAILCGAIALAMLHDDELKKTA